LTAVPKFLREPALALPKALSEIEVQKIRKISADKNPAGLG
jgi:hypothetical protein